MGQAKSAKFHPKTVKLPSMISQLKMPARTRLLPGLIIDVLTYHPFAGFLEPWIFKFL
jgi:hypothetical protein